MIKHQDMMNDQLAPVFAAVEAHRKACRVWHVSDRSEAFPQMAEGADTVTIGYVSCRVTPPPQNSNKMRMNWKIDGKRCTYAQAMNNLLAMTEAEAKTEEAQEVVQADPAAAPAPEAHQDVLPNMLVKYTFSSTVVSRLAELLPNILEYVGVDDRVLCGCNAWARGMREGKEVRDLIELFHDANSRAGSRHGVWMNSIQARVVQDRLEMAWEIADDNGRDGYAFERLRAKQFRSGVTHITNTLGG